MVGTQLTKRSDALFRSARKGGGGGRWAGVSFGSLMLHRQRAFLPVSVPPSQFHGDKTCLLLFQKPPHSMCVWVQDRRGSITLHSQCAFLLRELYNQKLWNTNSQLCINMEMKYKLMTMRMFLCDCENTHTHTSSYWADAIYLFIFAFGGFHDIGPLNFVP